MLGVLIRDARAAAGKSTADCAAALGIPDKQFMAYERGTQPISLPELEVLACVLRVPLAHFWSDQIITNNEGEQTPWQDVINIRHRMIGVQLRQARMEAGFTHEECANALGSTPERIKTFESGREPVPLPELEALAGFLGLPLESLVSESGPVGEQLKALQAFDDFTGLPEDVRDFVLDSRTKQGYLRLARRLSELPPEELRALGEALLESVM
jgi:transcriptional regulator with XRE-family HTH domain